MDYQDWLKNLKVDDIAIICGIGYNNSRFGREWVRISRVDHEFIEAESLLKRILKSGHFARFDRNTGIGTYLENDSGVKLGLREPTEDEIRNRGHGVNW